MNASERFWDKTASQYDQIDMKDEQTYINIIKRTKTHLKISSIVLDFGCGTGLIANEIAKYVKGIHAIKYIFEYDRNCRKKGKRAKHRKYKLRSCDHFR
ncbi:class I SAM-dependent methyltransferase [Paenibacillus sp. FSL W8-0187]|uniref:class I SAM-dependent methyltransferase n=1 Tax=unclassified Paenibacillus TaxID=185978 RepID=UPI0030D891F9